jgi:hypothetical protein
MLGRKVRTLANGRYPNGEHQVTFNANNLSSGIYIARLSVDQVSVRTINMALIK